ncbi:MAG: hypothetical protein ACQEXC_14305 [Pseudomonadota bacterium]
MPTETAKKLTRSIEAMRAARLTQRTRRIIEQDRLEALTAATGWQPPKRSATP